MSDSLWKTGAQERLPQRPAGFPSKDAKGGTRVSPFSPPA